MFLEHGFPEASAPIIPSGVQGFFHGYQELSVKQAAAVVNGYRSELDLSLMNTPHPLLLFSVWVHRSCVTWALVM